MKRTSAHLSQSSSAAPRRASDTPVVVESLRFREYDGKPSAYTRLYAQGVDQLVHKDLVYRQYGLHKSLPPSSTAQPPSRSSKPVETSAIITRSSSTVVHPTASSLRIRGSSAATTRVATSPRSHPALSTASTRQRPSSVAKPSKTAPPNAKKASIFNPQAKPQRRQSTIATQLLNKTLRIGAAVLHSADPIAAATVSGPPRSPRMSISAGGPPRSPRMSITSSGPLPPPTPSSTRRMSYQISTTPRSAGLPPAPSSTSASPSKPSGDATPAVLVPVSRRTSSPLVATTAGGDFGLRRRPSVSPIRGGASSSSLPSSSATSSTVDEATRLLQRRDSQVDRLVEQITVLKHSLGLSDEDLQWKVESTKGNAYEAADRHLTEAEEAYDRLVYEVQLLSETPCDEASAALARHLRHLATQSQQAAALKPQLSASQSDLARLKKQLKDATIARELRAATQSEEMHEDQDVAQCQQRVDAATQTLVALQQQLQAALSTLNDQLETLAKATDTLASACARFSFASTDAAAVSSQFLAILRCVPECSGDKLVALCEQGIALAATFTGSKASELKRKELAMATALRDIEVWKQRKEQSKEFGAETAKRERAWFEQERGANLASLAALRTLIPVDIAQLSVEQLLERAKERGVLYTYELASYLKTNRLLHWLVLHEADIARDNFLNGESFSNLGGYDVVELRAVSAVLPAQFEFDKDGKKAAWRRQFLDHVELLAKQQRGASIKAGWDPVKRARADVPLKPLSDKQRLNALYRYPSDDEIQARITRFQLQQQRLAAKKAKLEQLEASDIPTAKAEYLAVAEDARSEELQQLVGKATLIKMRDDAKAALQALTKTRDVVVGEIAAAERAWAQQTPSYAQFVEEAGQIRALPAELRGERIRGPFPSEVELVPRARAAFKKLSVEEEAQARRMELSQAIADRDKATSVVEEAVEEGGGGDGAKGTVEEPAAASEVVAAAEVESVGEDKPVAVEEQRSGGEKKSEETMKPPVDSFRRVKSLRVSVEVLRFLQNDFCSPRRTRSHNAMVVGESGVEDASPDRGGGGGDEGEEKVAVAVATTRRRPSLPKAPVVESVDAKPSVPKLPAEPPKPKSKALAALLQRQQQAATTGDGGEENSVPPPRQKFDFLSELKNKASKKGSGGADGGGETGSRPAVGFLGELKRRVAPVEEEGGGGRSLPQPVQEGGSSKPMGFLDEIKRRAKKSEPEEPAASSVPTSAAPRNFLDELKAKARRGQDQ